MMMDLTTAPLEWVCSTTKAVDLMGKAVGCGSGLGVLRSYDSRETKKEVFLPLQCAFGLL
jgi:hypothetical protein